jgi:hypothetical protein
MSDGTAHGTFDLDSQQLELTWRCREPMGVTHHAISVEQHDQCILAVEQSVDLIKDIGDMSATCVPKCHGSAFPLSWLPRRAGTSMTHRSHASAGT